MNACLQLHTAPDLPTTPGPAETALELDFTRPQHLQLRVCGRALILWDSIEPTEDWIALQLGPLLQVEGFLM